ncbi:unnamed protein product [Dicrocoelium dendriticum]|nr:unnamed protein product [Dicrocoelium dendriticum]
MAAIWLIYLLLQGRREWTGPAKPQTGARKARLISRYGGTAWPFSFILPHDIPSSIILYSGAGAARGDRPCGVEYTLQVFMSKSATAISTKVNSISLSIQRLTIAIPHPNPRPLVKALVRHFHIHSGYIKLCVILCKEIFFHGEPISIGLRIDNRSSNTVGRVTFQVTDRPKFCAVANWHGFAKHLQTILQRALIWASA